MDSYHSSAFGSDDNGSISKTPESPVGGEIIIESVDSICRDESPVGGEIIIESVDSIIESVECRDSADTQYMLIQTNLSKSPKQLIYKPL